MSHQLDVAANWQVFAVAFDRFEHEANEENLRRLVDAKNALDMAISRAVLAAYKRVMPEVERRSLARVGR